MIESERGVKVEQRKIANRQTHQSDRVLLTHIGHTFMQIYVRARCFLQFKLVVARLRPDPHLSF